MARTSRMRTPAAPRPLLIGEKLLRLTPYGVRVEGIDVVVSIGKQAATLDYETALKLATFLFNAGKIAKKAAGDHSLKVIGFAHLTDGTLEEMQAQSNRDRTAVFSRVK